ncbi:hypothetical protein GCM10010191_01780 [Actinomadura vinacea]|uniref:Uncharacterized protein n=1 Tax=Actinomadura vinacea TaxID=115336 RepID=A0ABN3IAY3_9ACTN
MPSATTPNALIYSAPAAGEQSGHFDGWLPEDDERGPICEYTGHAEGDQPLIGIKGNGNRAIPSAHGRRARSARLIEVDIDDELPQRGPPATSPCVSATPCSDLPCGGNAGDRSRGWPHIWQLRKRKLSLE